MRFYQLDSWDLADNDYFSLSIDGNSITGWALNYLYSGVYSLCGNTGFPDFEFTISLAYPHSASSLTLRMISGTNEDTINESFGFRDIKIEFLTNTSPYFSLCAPGVPSSYLPASRCQTSCTSSGNSISPSNYGFCFPLSCSANCKRCSDTSTGCTSCPTGSFLVGRTCSPTCDSPLSTKLLGGVTYCETPCPGQYAWWDGTCSSPCSYTTTYGTYVMAGTTVNTFQVCTYPCATNEFLYWNTSCLSSCPSPLLTTSYRNRNFCEYPCTSSEYLSWNGSCLSACPSPLSPETQGTIQQRNFCWYTCPETQYLYWNGSCLSTCPSPLSPETQGTTQQRNFCWYTCDVTEYLYWNQSCLNNCTIPLLNFNLAGNLFCFLPCSMPSIYWYQDLHCRRQCNFPYFLLYRDSVYQCLKPCSRPSEYFYDLEKECHDTCELPYVRQVINEIKVCHITSSTLSSEIERIEKTAGLLEVLGQTTSAILKAVIIPELSSPRSPLLAQLSSILQYIRYMRINYPWRVRLLFQANGTKPISLNFDFNIPNWVQDKLDDYPLPDVFEKYSLESNFINNMWDLMTTALLVIFVIFVLLLLRRLLKKYRKICYIITRILQSLQWNTLLAMICADSGEIIFYASLHIQNTPLGSTISIASLIITLLMIFFVLVTLGICFKILLAFHLQKQKRTPSGTPDWLEKWKGYEILYEEIEQESLFSLAYMAIYVIRSLLFFAIIANLYEYPLIQSLLLNLINLLIFCYLLYNKPLKSRLNIIQLFINEILGDIQTVCVLALANMDREETDDPYARFTLGNIIIAISIVFYVLGVVCLALEGVLFSRKTYQTWKEMRARGIRNPFKMIKILLFGEPSQTHPDKTTLELSLNSSMLNLSTRTDPVHFLNNHFQKPHSNTSFNSGSGIKTRRPRIPSEVTSYPSAERFTPFSGSKFDARKTRFEIQPSRPKRVVSQIPQRKIQHQHHQTKREEINRNKNTSGLMLQNFSPPFQPNINFTRGRGSSNARIKRPSRPVHQPYWSNK